MTSDLAPDPSAPALDADINALLDEAIAPRPMDAAATARVKSRLLDRVARDCSARHATVAADEGRWRDLGGGLQMKILHRDGDVMSYLVRMAPGSQLPAHRHPIDEECVVMEGAVSIAGRRIGSGGFHLGRKDVLHEPLVSEEGALLFLRGAVPDEALLV